MDFNNKVTVHSYGVSGFSDYNKGSEGAAKASFYKNLKESQNKKFADDKAVMESAIELKQNNMDKRNQRVINESKIANLHMKCYNDAKEGIMNHALCEGFIEALVLDEPFKEEHKAEITSVMESYLNENGGAYNIVKKAATTNKNNLFLKGVLEACNKLASKCADKNRQKAKDNCNPDILKFELDDDIKKEIEKEFTDISTLAGVVKEKVVTVVQTEKQRAVARQQYEEEINNDTNPEIVSEAVLFNLHRKNPLNETTFFNGLMIESNKEVLTAVAESATTKGTPVSESNHFSEEYSVASEGNLEQELTPDEIVINPDGLPSDLTDIDGGMTVADDEDALDFKTITGINHDELDTDEEIMAYESANFEKFNDKCDEIGLNSLQRVRLKTICESCSLQAIEERYENAVKRRAYLTERKAEYDNKDDYEKALLESENAEKYGYGSSVIGDESKMLEGAIHTAADEIGLCKLALQVKPLIEGYCSEDRHDQYCTICGSVLSSCTCTMCGTQNEFKTTTKYTMDDVQTESVIEDNAGVVIMDQVLCEAVTKYTIREYLHTGNFIKYNANDLRLETVKRVK